MLCVGEKHQLFDVCVILLTSTIKGFIHSETHTYTQHIQQAFGVLLGVAHTHTHFLFAYLGKDLHVFIEVMMFLSPNPHTILFALYIKSLFITFIKPFSS